jgi:hypothetical protein
MAIGILKDDSQLEEDIRYYLETNENGISEMLSLLSWLTKFNNKAL